MDGLLGGQVGWMGHWMDVLADQWTAEWRVTGWADGWVDGRAVTGGMGWLVNGELPGKLGDAGTEYSAQGFARKEPVPVTRERGTGC